MQLSMATAGASAIVIATRTVIAIYKPLIGNSYYYSMVLKPTMAISTTASANSTALIAAT